MGRMAQSLVRLAAYAAGGLIASLIASIIGANSNSALGEEVQGVWFLGLGALAGITSGVGLELARGAQRRQGGRTHPTVWPWLAAAGLGIVFGVLLATQPPWSSSVSAIATVAVLALALVNGLAVGSDARPGAFGRSLVAIALSLVAGIAFAAAGTAVGILALHPCPPHGYCLELSPVSMFLGAAVYALPVAVWLGVACWLSLGLGLRLQPRAWQEA